jgi:hypothetical protein
MLTFRIRWGDTALRPTFSSVDEVLHIMYCLLKVCSFQHYNIVVTEEQPCEGIELPS